MTGRGRWAIAGGVALWLCAGACSSGGAGAVDAGADLGDTSAGPSADLAPRIALLLASITAHAFWYTWIINRTGSVLLCILLHAGYNTSNGLLVLVPEADLHGAAEAVLLPIMTGVVVGSVLVLLAATRGRLGKPA